MTRRLRRYYRRERRRARAPQRRERLASFGRFVIETSAPLITDVLHGHLRNEPDNDR